MQPRLEPAHRIVTLLGGNNKVAELLNIHPGRVSYWKVSRERGGTGGVIPHWHVETLVRYARKHGIRLAPQDFAVELEPMRKATRR